LVILPPDEITSKYATSLSPSFLPAFISKPLSERELLGWAYVYEHASKRREMPKNYN